MNQAIRSLALIITLILLPATPGEARSPQGRHVIGMVQSVDTKGCRAVVISGDSDKAVAFVWNRHTVFASGAELVPAAQLKAGSRVEVILHNPFFGEPFVTKITFLDPVAKN